MTEQIKPATDEQIATIRNGLSSALPAITAADLAARFTVQILLARIEADREKITQGYEALGLLSTLAGEVQVDVDDPVSMAKNINRSVHEKIVALEIELAKFAIRIKSYRQQLINEDINKSLLKQKIYELINRIEQLNNE